jgi:hypothetical protein
MQLVVARLTENFEGGDDLLLLGLGSCGQRIAASLVAVLAEGDDELLRGPAEALDGLEHTHTVSRKSI